MAGDKNDMGSNVKVAGLLGMGVTLLLVGLSLLPKPYGNGFVGFWAAVPTAGIFGGVILILLGLIGLWKSHLFWGSAFIAYGAFFSIWSGTITRLATLTQVQFYGLAGFTFVFMLMTLTFLLSSPKHGWLTVGLFGFFFLSTIMWLVTYWMTAAGNSISTGQMWATAAITILTGLIAWYMATATLTNWTYGKKYLPG